MGVVNLFGDMTYEGGASINGPLLGSLGASAAIVSIVAGVGEFLGYSLGYGGGWLIGSVATGLLYEHSRIALIVFAAAAQIASVPLFLLGAQVLRARRRKSSGH